MAFFVGHEIYELNELTPGRVLLGCVPIINNSVQIGVPKLPKTKSELSVTTEEGMVEIARTDHERLSIECWATEGSDPYGPTKPIKTLGKSVAGLLLLRDAGGDWWAHAPKKLKVIDPAGMHQFIGKVAEKAAEYQPHAANPTIL